MRTDIAFYEEALLNKIEKDNKIKWLCIDKNDKDFDNSNISGIDRIPNNSLTIYCWRDCKQTPSFSL